MLAELTHPEIEEVLTNGYIGRIGYKDDEDSVQIVPVNYAYKQGYVQCYSLAGAKVKMMRKHQEVCFEVEEIADNDDWKTGICHGVYEEITDEKELELLRPEYTEYILRKRATISALPPDANRSAKHTDAELSTPVIYRIRFSKFSGREDKGF